MSKKLLVLFWITLSIISFVSASSLIKWSEWFDLLEYKIDQWNKIQLIFSQPLIEEPLNVEIFDTSGNLLFIDSIDYLSWRTIAVLNIWQILSPNETYKMNLISVFWTTWFITQNDDEFVDIIVDWSYLWDNQKIDSNLSAQDLFNQTSWNIAKTHNAAQDNQLSSDLFGEDIQLDNDLLWELSSFEDSPVEVQTTNVNLTNENNLSNNVNNLVETNTESNLSQDNANNKTQTWTWSSVITGIPKTWPATNILIITALLLSSVYFIIRKNVAK